MTRGTFHENSGDLYPLPDFVAHTDWDDTLFNTPALAKQFFTHVGQLVGQSYVDVRLDGSQPYARSAPGIYSLKGHMEYYGLDPEEQWVTLEEMLADPRQDYLFPDSAPYVQGTLQEKFRLNILTFGDQRLQQLKVAHYLERLAGSALLAQSISVEIVQRPKAEHLAEHYPNQPGSLVDNSAPQRLRPPATEIHLVRGRGLSAPKQTQNGWEVSDLYQALDVNRLLRQQAGETS